MISTPKNFSKKQWRFDMWDLMTLIFTSSILFLLCGTGNSTTLLKLDLETLIQGDGKLSVTCSLQQNNEAKVGNNSLLCKNSTFDAIITYRDETFVLKGDHYWKHINRAIAPDYPKLISTKWPGLPGNIDTAFTDNAGQYTYFFKGSQYWKFNGENLESGFPKSIRGDFPGIPDNLQAAAIWSGNGQLYLFKGEEYWRVDMSRRPIDISQPSPMRNWIGIPGNLDAALHSFGSVTFFFKGGKYYKYNDKTESVEIDDPPYPKRIASNWFGCPKIVKIVED